MEVKIKTMDGMIDAVGEMADGVMVVTPKGRALYSYESEDITKFKDGDIIVCGYGVYEWICILKGEIEKNEESGDLYIDGYCSYSPVAVNDEPSIDTVNGDSDSADYVRYATDKEKAELFAALEKEWRVWDAENKVMLNSKRKPEHMEECYIVNYTLLGFLFDKTSWLGTDYQKHAFRKGWVFPLTEHGKVRCTDLCKKLNKAVESVKEGS